MLPLRPPEDLLLDFPPDDCDRPPEDFDFQLPFDWEEWRLPDGVDPFEPARHPFPEPLLEPFTLPLEGDRKFPSLLLLGRPRRPPSVLFASVLATNSDSMFSACTAAVSSPEVMSSL